MRLVAIVLLVLAATVAVAQNNDAPTISLSLSPTAVRTGQGAKTTVRLRAYL